MEMPSDAVDAVDAVDARQLCARGHCQRALASTASTLTEPLHLQHGLGLHLEHRLASRSRGHACLELDALEATLASRSRGSRGHACLELHAFLPITRHVMTSLLFFLARTVCSKLWLSAERRFCIQLVSREGPERRHTADSFDVGILLTHST